MSISEKDIKHIAKLSALEISEKDVPKFTREIGNILEYVDGLSSVVTRGVVPTCHVHGAVNFFRDDIVKDSLSIEDLSKNAPDFSAGNFRVPKII